MTIRGRRASAASAGGLRQDGSRGRAGHGRAAGAGPGLRAGLRVQRRRRRLGLRGGRRRSRSRVRGADGRHPRAGPRGQRPRGRPELRRRGPDAAQRLVRLPRGRRPGAAPRHEGRERQGGADHRRSRRGAGGARRQRGSPVHGPHGPVRGRPQGPEPLQVQRAGARPRVGRERPGDAAVPHRQLRPLHARHRHPRRGRPVAGAGGALLPHARRPDRHQGGHDHGGGRGRRRSRAHERVRAAADEQREPLRRPRRREQRRGPGPAAGALRSARDPKPVARPPAAPVKYSGAFFTRSWRVSSLPAPSPPRSTRSRWPSRGGSSTRSIARCATEARARGARRRCRPCATTSGSRSPRGPSASSAAALRTCLRSRP